MNYTKLKQEYEQDEQQKQEEILNNLYLEDLNNLCIEFLKWDIHAINVKDIT